MRVRICKKWETLCKLWQILNNYSIDNVKLIGILYVIYSIQLIR
jgi:hypothetical protein